MSNIPRFNYQKQTNYFYQNKLKPLKTSIPERRSGGWTRGRIKLLDDTLKSIVKIAGKHDLDPKLLVESLVEAWRNETSNCGSLKTSYRQTNKDYASFLITKEEKVIAQFPINLELLRNPESMKNHIQHIPKFKPKQKLDQENKEMKIAELRFGMKKVSLKAKIMEMSPVKHLISKWGNPCRLSNAKITDDSGTIKLTLWGNHINKFNVGDKIEIKNSSISRFANELQVRLNRKSTISLKPVIAMKVAL
jgi:replication factor A1